MKAFLGMKKRNIFLLCLFLLVLVFLFTFSLVNSGDEDKENLNDGKGFNDGTELITLKNKPINRNSVYESDLVLGAKVLRLGLVDDLGINVPITVLVSGEKLMEDFDGLDISSYDMYLNYSQTLDELGLGFLEYHPLEGILYEDKADEGNIYLRLNNDLSKDYDEFVKVLEDSFGSDFDNVILEEGNGVEETVISLGNEKLYYKYESSDGKEFLVYDFNKDDFSVEDAVLSLKLDNDEYESIIPEDVLYDVIVTGDIVEVNFLEEFDLSMFSNKEILSMVEGLNLTVNSFGKGLKLNNVSDVEWEGFNFSEVLEYVVGVNKVYLN